MHIIKQGWDAATYILVALNLLFLLMAPQNISYLLLYTQNVNDTQHILVIIIFSVKWKPSSSSSSSSQQQQHAYYCSYVKTNDLCVIINIM